MNVAIMDSQVFIVAIAVMFIAAITNAEQDCERPAPMTLFTNANDGEGDIVLTIVYNDPVDQRNLQWAVTGASKDFVLPVTDYFEMEHRGPMWNLVVAKQFTSDNQDIPMAFVRVELECTNKKQSKTSTYQIHMAVFYGDKSPYTKVLIKVPENIPVGSAIYRDTIHLTGSQFSLLPLSEEKNYDLAARRHFLLNETTGAVMLSTALDYEADDSKVMWMLVKSKIAKQSIIARSLFRIEVQNINDNPPEFRINRTCTDDCTVTSYTLAMDKKGQLTEENGAEIFARDRDGDRITYSLRQDSENEKSPFAIDNITGEMTTNVDNVNASNTYFLQVKASDGVFIATANLTILPFESFSIKDPMKISASPFGSDIQHAKSTNTETTPDYNIVNQTLKELIEQTRSEFNMVTENKPMTSDVGDIKGGSLSRLKKASTSMYPFTGNGIEDVTSVNSVKFRDTTGSASMNPANETTAAMQLTTSKPEEVVDPRQGDDGSKGGDVVDVKTFSVASNLSFSIEDLFSGRFGPANKDTDVDEKQFEQLGLSDMLYKRNQLISMGVTIPRLEWEVEGHLSELCYNLSLLMEESGEDAGVQLLDMSGADIEVRDTVGICSMFEVEMRGGLDYRDSSSNTSAIGDDFEFVKEESSSGAVCKVYPACVVNMAGIIIVASWFLMNK